MLNDVLINQPLFINSLFRYVEVVNVVEEGSIMDYFLVSKHQTVEENILFTSKMLFQLLDTEQHVDELFLQYAEERNITLNLNIERILYLSLTLLFSMGLITANQNMIKRNTK